MIELELHRRVHGPVEATFAILTDLEQYLARWAQGPTAAVKVDGDGGSGTRYRVKARVGPVKVRSPYVVGIWEPPHRFGGSGIAGPVRFVETYALAGKEGSTDVRYTVQARPRGPFRLVEPLIGRHLRTLIDGDLDRFKQLVESTA